MDKYEQIDIWENQYRLEHPHIENGYNKADILEWLAEKKILHDIRNNSTHNVNRVEVIDENGRSYVNWNPKNRVYTELQDQGRTLKVFISNS